MNEMIFPKGLQKGDMVGLISPASKVSVEEGLACNALLEQLGYQVKMGECVKQNDEDIILRASDVNHMFENPKIKAIFCTRGGYGSAELLPYLDYTSIKQNPKIFVGYSDITSLHVALGKMCNLVTFHGPMVWSKMVPREHMSVVNTVYSVTKMFREFERKGEGAFENPPGEKLKIILEGSASGRLFGGNLSVLTRLLGTPYSPVGLGEILFLEDVNEPVGKLRMNLVQMEQAGLFENVKGILLGDFTDCLDGEIAIEVFLKEWLAHLNIPVMGNVCSDHRMGAMATLSLGGWCEINSKKDCAPRNRRARAVSFTTNFLSASCASSAERFFVL